MPQVVNNQWRLQPPRERARFRKSCFRNLFYSSAPYIGITAPLTSFAALLASHTIKLEIEAEIVVKAAELAQA